MNTSLIEKLKTKVDCDLCNNTNDLVNGLFVTITSTTKIDYADAYELLEPIQRCFYEVFKLEPTNLKIKTSAPNLVDIDNIMFLGTFISVFSIGCNKTGDKVHIHAWVYNFHHYNMRYDKFTSKLTKNLRDIKGISRRNEFGIKLIPVNDPIDSELRKNNDDHQVIVNYITQRNYGTLMNYLSFKNNKHFLYFY